MQNNFWIRICFLLAFGQSAFAQDGPGGVGSTDGTSTLVLWLAADNGVSLTNDGHVQEWDDLSGYGSNAFPSNSNEPTLDTTNGISALVFNKESQLAITDADAIGTAGTVFIVVKDFNGGREFSMQAGNQKNEFKLNAFYRYADPTDYVYVTSSCSKIIPKSKYRIFEARWISSLLSFDYYVNGVISNRSHKVVGNGGAQSLTFSTIYLGDNDPLNQQEDFKGKISEFIIYSEYLSDDDFNAVNQYLNCKYSLETDDVCSNFLPCGEKFAPNSEQSLQVYPNPVSDGFVTIDYYSHQTESMQLVLMNSMGQIALELPVKALKGENTATLNVKNLPEGSYILMIKSEGALLKKPILVMH